MLALRLQRTGRKGHAQYRLVAQDSRRHPSSGKVAAYLGSYDPHAKHATLKLDRVKHYLSVGAQPSERVARLLKGEGVKLPNWVAKPRKLKGTVRHPEKLRRNRPAGAEAVEGKPAEEAKPAEAPDVVPETGATAEPEKPAAADEAVTAVETEQPAEPEAVAAEPAAAEKPAEVA
jgi:small subunit ribosomal protein S16